MLKMLHYVCISEPLIKWVKTYGGVELVFFVYYIVSFSGKQSPRTSGNLSATDIFYDYCRNLSHKNLPFLGEKERIKLYVCMFFEKVWIYWASQVALVVKNLPAQCRRHKRRGLNPWVRKTPPEEGVATHSSTLLGESPWTEEPGGLQSMGSQTVGQDWSDLA